MEFFADFSLLTLSLLGVIALMTLWFAGPGYNSHSAAHSPTILTSVGIFGTFLGVALGLLAFDTDNIQNSVPGLIEGLKTAFWTSIAGLLGALLVKFRHLFAVLGQRQVEETYREATVTDLANLLGDIRASLSDEAAGGLHHALMSSNREQQQAFNQFRETLEAYESRMVEANTRALIGALKEVMRDFNTQINEQYGDNFKELNQAVGQMLTWQESYKAELEELLASQQANGQLLDKASQAYEKMVGHSAVFTEVSNALGVMLEGLQTQSHGLDNYLTQLAKVADQAAAGLPTLESRVAALTTELADSVTSNQQRLSQLLEESAQGISQTVTSVNQTMTESLLASQQGLQETVEQMVQRTEQQVMRLDDAMEDELVKALKTFGYQLTSLSEKFVSDYGPLTEKLQALVAMAESTGHSDEPQRNKRLGVPAR